MTTEDVESWRGGSAAFLTLVEFSAALPLAVKLSGSGIRSGCAMTRR
jgi:hypothetical protein